MVDGVEARCRELLHAIPFAPPEHLDHLGEDRGVRIGRPGRPSRLELGDGRLEIVRVVAVVGDDRAALVDLDQAEGVGGARGLGVGAEHDRELREREVLAAGGEEGRGFPESRLQHGSSVLEKRIAVG